MKTASVAHVKARFSAYVRASAGGLVVVTRNGRAVAAIISIAADADLERLMLGYSPRLRAILSAARERSRSGAGVPHDRFWREAKSARSRPRKRKT